MSRRRRLRTMVRLIKFRTSRARERYRKVILAKAALIGVLLLIGIAATIIVMRLEVLQIRRVVIIGAQALSPVEIENFVRNELSGSYFKMVPRTNALFVRETSLEAEVRGAFPRLSSAELTRDGMHVIALTVTERGPYALWCGDIVPTVMEQTDLGGCYVLDDTGFIFAPAPQFMGAEMIRFWGPLEDPEPLGSQFIAGDEFRHVDAFVRLLISDGLKVFGLLIVDESEMELYLQNGTKVLLLRDTETFSDTRINLISLMNSPEYVEDEAQSGIEYVDARFGNRMYYKPNEKAVIEN